jgi:hypothetical protein
MIWIWRLVLGIAAGNGDYRGADPFCTVVEAKTAGEQAVTEGNLDDIILGDTGCRKNPGNQIGPGLDVIPGVAHNCRHPGRPG